MGSVMRHSAILCSLLMMGPALAQADLSGTAPVSCQQEAECLSKLGGKARRDGDVLTLRLEGEKTKTFKTNQQACEKDDADHCIVYELRAYRPAQKVYVVGWSLYEGEGAGLVSLKTGDVLALPSLPVFSPSGQRFAIVGNDLHGAPEFQVGIWSLEAGKAKEEFRYSAVHEEDPEIWSILNWDGETRIRFKVGFEFKSIPSAETDAVLQARHWVLNWPAAKAK